MQYYNNLEEIRPDRPTVVTLGKFDGLHRGHQKLLKVVEEFAKTKNLKTALFTFDVSPQAKLGKRDNSVLVTNDEKRDLIENFGLDYMIECPFTEEVRNMTADDFVRDVLMEKLNAKAIVIGEDFRFGKERQGSAKFLKDNATEYGLNVRVIEKEKDSQNNREISSTYIREELLQGNIEKVNELLGFDYFIAGEIVKGMSMGRGFGFPTINIVPEPEKILPPFGVYVSVTEFDGKLFRSITNIGTKPTVSGKEIGVETFILDFEGDLYGKKAVIMLKHFMRPEKKFASIEELTAQVLSDIEDRRKMI